MPTVYVGGGEPARHRLPRRAGPERAPASAGHGGAPVGADLHAGEANVAPHRPEARRGGPGKQETGHSGSCKLLANEGEGNARTVTVLLRASS